MRPRGGFFSALRAQGAGTDYRHQEIEGDGSVGTTFANDGSDARLEAVHRALALGGGQLEGSFGLQYESSDFSALGEEAFVPSTHTRQQSVFVLERWSWGEGGSVSSGLRAEQVRVRSGGDADPEEPQFGPAQERRFSPFSAALGAVMKLDERWQLSANASSHGARADQLRALCQRRACGHRHLRGAATRSRRWKGPQSRPGPGPGGGVPTR
ncbi:MAG: TonB-dependent receptor [Betaproteobacteria bacterium]|nr:TonB-dependent receptor [Betaproteobacteria bacterium]